MRRTQSAVQGSYAPLGGVMAQESVSRGVILDYINCDFLYLND